MDRPSSHSQKVPYARKERRKSLFSKVKDSVKEMLSPSWLSDIVSNVKKDSPPSGSNDKVTKDKEMFTSPVSSISVPVGMQRSGMQQANFLPFQNQLVTQGNGQPRTLDFRSSTPQAPAQNEMMSSPYLQANLPPPISEFTSSQLPLARLTQKSDSVLANEDAMSQRSDASKSTSGCSSMVPQTDAQGRDTMAEKRKASDQDNPGSKSSHLQVQPTKRQRLQVNLDSSKMWSKGLSGTPNKQQAPAVVNKPSFNASLFGSPMNDESSLLGTSFHESSFYPGKTMYGGRSSASFRSKKHKTDLNQSLPSRLTIPVKAFMKAKPRVNPAKEAVTSSTAKRILDALDKMPTPLNDARRIPMIVPQHWTESPSFFSRDKTTSRSGPPTQKLNISSLASISKNRQVSSSPIKQPQPSGSQVRPMRDTLPTRQDTVILGSGGLSGSAIPSGKMRRDKSYHKGSASVKAVLEEEDTVILPELNTNFKLPISSMLQINFDTPTNSSGNKPAVNFTFSSPIQECIPQTKSASPGNVTGFQFSSPICVDKKTKLDAIRIDKMDSTLAPKSKNLFAFASPSSSSAVSVPKMNGPSTPSSSFGGMKTASELKQGSVMSVLGSGSNNTGGFKAADELKQGSVMDILGGNDNSGSGFKAASELKQGSVMDILGGNDNSGSGFKAASELKQGSVMDILGGSSLKSSKVGGEQQSEGPAFSSVFKASGWSCDVCLLNNKEDANKCLACMTPRPASQKQKTAAPAAPKPDVSKSNLLAQFQQPTGSWTCDVCLISNKADISKCAACQTQKPGLATPSHTSLVSSHGTLMPGNWICTTCLIQNKEEADVCGACKASKPSIPASAPNSSSTVSSFGKDSSLFNKFKAPSGQWECEVCLVQNKTEASVCVACQTPKPLKFFKHPPGDWVCDTCLVNNKESDVKCVACNYARPGPPRTHTVPSCVKEYTKSQTGAFNHQDTKSSDSDKSTNISISSTGGFKFGDSQDNSLGTNSTSGFKFGTSTEKSSDLKPGSGFKFGSGTTTSGTNPTSGFKFGTSSSLSNSDNSDKTSSGGFKFGSGSIEGSDSKITTGFKFGSSESDTKENSKALPKGGFQFETPTSATSNNVPEELKSVSSNSVVSTSSSLQGGISFSKTSENSSSNNPLKSTSSVPGGFNFKSSDSLTSAKTGEASISQTSATSQGIGGFNFGVKHVNNASPIVSLQNTSSAQNSVGGFQFTATKVEQSSSSQDVRVQNSTESKGFSGFQPSEVSTSKPATFSGGFNLAQKPTAVQNSSVVTFGGNKDTTSVVNSTKRGRDEDSGETQMKKQALSFGSTAANAASTPFQFGVTNKTSITSSTSITTNNFVFGKPQPTSASTPTIGFNFTSSSASSAPKSVFGGASAMTGQTASNPPVFGSSSTPFNFTGQKTESSTAVTTPAVFQFGAKQTQSATTAAAPAFGSTTFGSGSTPAFGTGATPTFGSSTASSTPAFGAAPSSFGSTNTGTISTAAPVFGGNRLVWNSRLTLPITVTHTCSLVTVAHSPVSLSKSNFTSSVFSTVDVLSCVAATTPSTTIPVYTGLSGHVVVSSQESSADILQADTQNKTILNSVKNIGIDHQCVKRDCKSEASVEKCDEHIVIMDTVCSHVDKEITDSTSHEEEDVSASISQVSASKSPVNKESVEFTSLVVKEETSSMSPEDKESAPSTSQVIASMNPIENDGAVIVNQVGINCSTSTDQVNKEVNDESHVTCGNQVTTDIIGEKYVKVTNAMNSVTENKDIMIQTCPVCIVELKCMTADQAVQTCLENYARKVVTESSVQTVPVVNLFHKDCCTRTDNQHISLHKSCQVNGIRACIVSSALAGSSTLLSSRCTISSAIIQASQYPSCPSGVALKTKPCCLPLFAGNICSPTILTSTSSRPIVAARTVLDATVVSSTSILSADCFNKKELIEVKSKSADLPESLSLVTSLPPQITAHVSNNLKSYGLSTTSGIFSSTLSSQSVNMVSGTKHSGLNSLVVGSVEHSFCPNPVFTSLFSTGQLLATRHTTYCTTTDSFRSQICTDTAVSTAEVSRQNSSVFVFKGNTKLETPLIKSWIGTPSSNTTVTAQLSAVKQTCGSGLMDIGRTLLTYSRNSHLSTKGFERQNIGELIVSKDWSLPLSKDFCLLKDGGFVTASQPTFRPLSGTVNQHNAIHKCPVNNAVGFDERETRHFVHGQHPQNNEPSSNMFVFGQQSSTASIGQSTITLPQSTPLGPKPVFPVTDDVDMEDRDDIHPVNFTSAGTFTFISSPHVVTSAIPSLKKVDSYPLCASVISGISGSIALTVHSKAKLEASVIAGTSGINKRVDNAYFQASTSQDLKTILQAGQLKVIPSAVTSMLQAVTNSIASYAQADKSIDTSLTGGSNNMCHLKASTFTSTTELKAPATPRKVCFSFCPPLNVALNDEKRQPSPRRDKSTKSILKTKTNEMVSAFSSTTLFGTEVNPESTSDTSVASCGLKTFTPSKDPSTSSIFGGVKDFISADSSDTKVSKKKSVVFEPVLIFGDNKSNVFDVASSSKTSLKTYVNQLQSKSDFRSGINLDKKELDKYDMKSQVKKVSVSVQEPEVSPGVFVFKGATTKLRSLFTTSLAQQSFPKKLMDNKTTSDVVSAFSGSTTTKKSLFPSTTSDVFVFTGTPSTTCSITTTLPQGKDVSASSSERSCHSAAPSSSTSSAGTADSSDESSSSDSDNDLSDTSTAATCSDHSIYDSHRMEEGGDEEKEKCNKDKLASSSSLSSESFSAFSGKGNRSWNAQPADKNNNGSTNEPTEKISEKELCKLLSYRFRATDQLCIFLSASSISVFPVFSRSSAGVFNNSMPTAAPAQTASSVLQFGVKQAESNQPVAGTGFSFNANPAGLGSTPDFNFASSAAPGNFAFNATATPGQEPRKIKRAVRKLKR